MYEKKNFSEEEMCNYLNAFSDVLYVRFTNGRLGKSDVAKLKKAVKRLYYCVLELSRKG